LPVGAPFPFCGGSGGRNRTFSNTIHFQKFIGVPPHLHISTQQHTSLSGKGEKQMQALWEVAIGSMYKLQHTHSDYHIPFKWTLVENRKK
jgi:hypothetical protein